MRAHVAAFVRRLIGRRHHRLRDLPILALHVHTACNCRCVMCDIWKANERKRSLGVEELEAHAEAIRRLRVRRVMLTGGEPLMHRNLWELADRLRAFGIRLTLVTTGLLLEAHAAAIHRSIDEVVVSLDGPPDVHDAIRRVPDGFARVARGIAALAASGTPPRLVARCVVQRGNHTALARTVDAVQTAGAHRLSFLAADVSSPAFNRPDPWDAARRAEVAVSAGDLPALAAAIDEVAIRCRQALASGFVVGGLASLQRIHQYYAALADRAAFPTVRCDAPWMSAVLEPGGVLRPCFFHPAYDVGEATTLDEALNAPRAIAFRRRLRVATDPTCQRCVCSLRR